MASLYFIQNSEVGIVKIGISEYVEQRRQALEFACGFELRIRRVVRGGAGYEARLHAAFGGCRRVGEWFNCVPELEQLMAGPETIAAFLSRHRLVVAKNLELAAADRSRMASGRAIEQFADRYARIGAELDDLFGSLPVLIPGRKGADSGDIEADSPIMTRAGLEPATYGLKGPEPIAGETPSDSDESSSEDPPSGVDRRSAPESGATSPGISPDDDPLPPVAAALEAQR